MTKGMQTGPDSLVDPVDFRPKLLALAAGVALQWIVVINGTDAFAAQRPLTEDPSPITKGIADGPDAVDPLVRLLTRGAFTSNEVPVQPDDAASCDSACWQACDSHISNPYCVVVGGYCSQDQRSCTCTYWCARLGNGRQPRPNDAISLEYLGN